MKRVLICIALALIALTSTAATAGASMSDQPGGSFDTLILFQKDQADVRQSTIAAFLLPGWAQMNRGQTVEACLMAVLDLASLALLFNRETVTEGGDTYLVFRVNWWAAFAIIANHIYSGFSTARWGESRIAQLRVQYGIDKIILGVAF